MRKFLWLLAVLAVALAAFIWLSPARPHAGTSLRIVSGSENKALEPIIQQWAEASGAQVRIEYQGSLDIARTLGQGRDAPFDVVWPANALWIEMGDTQNVVRQRESIFRSPVVLGVKRSIAGRLGWVSRDDITIQDIQLAAEQGAFRLAMTSATQSNSGASAYLGFVYALAGNPDTLTAEILASPDLQDRVRALLAQVDRSSGSSGWLAEALVANPGGFDAMFNYEALMIETNQALAKAGDEPLWVVYPANGLAVADSPMGLIDRGDTRQQAAFSDLLAYLQSPETQAKLAAEGRRTSLIGLEGNADPSVWNPDWGLDPARQIAPLPTPAGEVVAEALRLYQAELRKPSFTIWVLDVSGSMAGDPLAEVKEAMRLLLDPGSAALDLLEPTPHDVTVILPFNHLTADPTIIDGTQRLNEALRRVEGLDAGGGTDVYRALGTALDLLQAYDLDGSLRDYLPAIVVLTDGASDTGNRRWLMAKLQASGLGARVPVHAIAFGEADYRQLGELTEATTGRLFDATSDMMATLRAVRGYN